MGRSYHAVPVLGARDETDALRSLVLDVSGVPGLAGSYTVPGQYTVARVDDGDLYLALANAPGSDRFELLVAAGGDRAERLREAQPGDTVEVSPAEGKGFAFEPRGDDELLLLATRAAVAPMRALIQLHLKAPLGWGRVRFVWGARRDAHYPYRSEWAGWTDGGIELVLGITGDEPAWSGPRGRIPVLLRDPDSPLYLSAPESTWVLLVGSTEMMADTRAALVECGVPDDRIASNF